MCSLFAEIDPWYSYFAWPGFVCVLLFALAVLFRAPLIELISRVQKFKDAEFRPSPQTAKSLSEGDPKLNTGSGPDILKQIRPLSDYEIPLFEAFKRDLADMHLEPAQQLELLLRAITRERHCITFERISRVIYGTQLSFLLQINSTDQGLSVDQAEDFYKQRAQDLAKINVPFEQWLKFLLTSNLLRRTGNQLEATQFARDFIERLAATRDTAMRQY